jgi:hypothetical protein
MALGGGGGNMSDNWIRLVPEGFGCLVVDAINPDIGKLEDRYRQEFEGILGTKLRVIYQRI